MQIMHSISATWSIRIVESSLQLVIDILELD